MNNNDRRVEPITGDPGLDATPEHRPAPAPKHEPEPEPAAPAPRRDFTVAVSPAQLAGGLAIVAGLIAIALARRRRVRGRASSDEG